MRLRFIWITFILLLLTFALALEPVAALTPEEITQKIEETKREREALMGEQRRLQAELDAISRRGQSLASTVSALDATRRKLTSDINLTRSKISSTNLNIEMLENSLNQKGRQIDVHRLAIASAIQTLADQDRRPILLDLLGSQSFSEVWDTSGRIVDVSDTLYSEIHALRDTRAILDREKQMREENKEELLGLQTQLDGQKQVVEENKSAQERLLAETKRKEAEYQKMIADLVAQQKAFDTELFRYESELRIILDPSKYPSPQRGILAWPLDNVYITQNFGKTSASGRLYSSGTHNGVDFRAAMGTPVRAVLDGVVEGVGNTDEQRGCYSYGRWILIRHPNGLSTIYSHLSASLVRTGQSVSTGTIIGYSGGTPRTDGAGYSTGPHLHLGLFASQGVRVQQFTSSINCKQVFVPMADAKAYLDPLAYLPVF